MRELDPNLPRIFPSWIKRELEHLDQQAEEATKSRSQDKVKAGVRLDIAIYKLKHELTKKHCQGLISVSLALQEVVTASMELEDAEKNDQARLVSLKGQIGQ